MRFFKTMPRSESRMLLLRRMALVLALTLGPLLAIACWQGTSPPAAERSTSDVADKRATGTSSNPAANPTPAGQPSPSLLVPRGTLTEVYPELRSLAASPMFTITDESAGLLTEGTTSVKLQCTLIRTQTEFAGVGVGWVGFHRFGPPNDSAKRQVETPVQVPIDAAERFLGDLATVPVADGPYRPTSYTDAAFHLGFTISTATGPVLIFSDAHPAERLQPSAIMNRGTGPWAVQYGGRLMVIDSVTPTVAYRRIAPYLDELRKMTNDELGRLIQAPGPTTSPSPLAR